MPNDIRTELPVTIARCSGMKWMIICGMVNPTSDSEQPADAGEDDGLDQELLGDVAALGPEARRMPISRVRSVTVASMMFMMPMPPTSSEIEAMVPRMMLNCRACRWASISRS